MSAPLAIQPLDDARRIYQRTKKSENAIAPVNPNVRSYYVHSHGDFS